MHRYPVRLTDRAEADLRDIHTYLTNVASPQTARGYVDRIISFLDGLEQFPLRGSVHAEMRAGLRVIGFERRVSIAFVVSGDVVVILRILYGGRALSAEELD